MKKRKYTLEEIRQRQDALQAELKQSEVRLTKGINVLRQPQEKPVGFVAGVLAKAQQMSFAIDGALLGYKVYRALRKPKKLSRRR